MTEDLGCLANSWRTLDSASSMIRALRSAFSASDIEVGSEVEGVVDFLVDLDLDGFC